MVTYSTEVRVAITAAIPACPLFSPTEVLKGNHDHVIVAVFDYFGTLICFDYFGWCRLHSLSELMYFGANVVRAHARCACEGGRSGH